jgi:predicted site-specific integrase-resolvase
MPNDRAQAAVVRVEPILVRRRDTAAALGVSESQVLQWERQGLLPVVKLPGIRASRHRYEDVKRLGKKLMVG